MAVFGNGQGRGQEEKVAQLLKRYGLEELTDPRDYDSVQRIAQDLLGTGLLSLGATLTPLTKSEDKVKMAYLKVLMEQNFIIIRQLDRLNANLEYGPGNW